MTEAHWKVLLLLFCLIGLMLCFSLYSRPRTRLYRAVRHVFWGGAALYSAHLLGGVGMNAFTLAAAACLGAPGVAGMWILSGL